MDSGIKRARSPFSLAPRDKLTLGATSRSNSDHPIRAPRSLLLPQAAISLPRAERVLSCEDIEEDERTRPALIALKPMDLKSIKLLQQLPLHPLPLPPQLSLLPPESVDTMIRELQTNYTLRRLSPLLYPA
jgi:hypothetical protein